MKHLAIVTFSLCAVAPWALAEEVVFTIDSAASSITWNDNAILGPDLVVPLPPQTATGNLTNYEGEIIGDLNGETLTFSLGSFIQAIENENVADFTPFEGGPGGPEDPAAQRLNYSYELPDFQGTTLYVSLFDIVLDLEGGSITNGQPASGFDVVLAEGGYALVLDDPDIVNDTSWFNKPFDVIEGVDPLGANTSGSNATLVTNGNTQTLTLPIETEFFFNIDLCCGNVGPAEFIVNGQLVATRSLGGGVPSDLNNDGSVDAADAAIMFADWGANADSIADLNNDGFVDASDAGTLFAAWTGEPAEPADQSATAEYNFVTGQLLVSAKNVVNVFVESAGGGLTPGGASDVPAGLLLSDNANRVGLTGFAGINVTNWGAAIGAGLAESDLSLVVGPALGVPSVTHAAGTAEFAYVPEPTSMALLLLGGTLLLASGRRSQ